MIDRILPTEKKSLMTQKSFYPFLPTKAIPSNFPRTVRSSSDSNNILKNKRKD